MAQHSFDAQTWSGGDADPAHRLPGHADGWHHHGDHHVIAYLITGKVRIEWGVDGGKALEPAPGDLVHIEPGTIHRETYEGRVEIVGFTVGSGPGRVNVEGPEREA